MTAEPLVDDGMIAWAAGVLDVRGYFSERGSSQHDRRLPTVAVTLPDRGGEAHPVIDMLSCITSVEPVVIRKDFNRTQCGAHCPEPHVHTTGSYRRWSVGGMKAVVVLSACRRYLTSQQVEADRLIRLGQDGNWKKAHVASMARLGWPVAALIAEEFVA